MMKIIIVFAFFNQCFGFRVMTLDTSSTGINAHYRTRSILQHINAIQPDVVALQQVELGFTAGLVSALGPQWKVLDRSRNVYPDTAILTKHEFVPDSRRTFSNGVGASIIIGNSITIDVWSLHLDFRNYGPFLALNERQYHSVENILATEQQSRLQQIIHVIERTKNNNIPTIIAGSFNTPSHLDWTYECRGYHKNRVIEWPVTKMLRSNGFNDAYRVANSDCTSQGITWSNAVESSTNPSDRIDYIFYKGSISPTNSQVYEGSGRSRRYSTKIRSSWPFDHSAVITDFSKY